MGEQADGIDMFTLEDCTPGRILQTSTGELIKVQGVKFNRMRGTVLYPLQKQTTIREYSAEGVALMHEPKDSLLRKYEEAKANRRRK